MAKRVVKTTVTTIKDNSTDKKKKVKKKVRAKKRKSSKKVSSVKKKSYTREEINYSKKIYEGLEKRDNILVENFVGLQKAMATLSVRFSELSQNISNLLIIFEEAAKILAESEKQVDKSLVTKLDELIEQNKNLSREISMVDSKMKRGSSKQSFQAPLYSRQMNSQGQQQSAFSSSIPPKQLPNP
jgi:hypothetical protein